MVPQCTSICNTVEGCGGIHYTLDKWYRSSITPRCLNSYSLSLSRIHLSCHSSLSSSLFPSLFSSLFPSLFPSLSSSLFPSLFPPLLYVVTVYPVSLRQSCFPTPCVDDRGSVTPDRALFSLSTISHCLLKARNQCLQTECDLISLLCNNNVRNFFHTRLVDPCTKVHTYVRITVCVAH